MGKKEPLNYGGDERAYEQVFKPNFQGEIVTNKFI